MNMAGIKAVMNGEGNEDDCNGDLCWSIVHMKRLGSSKELWQDG